MKDYEQKTFDYIKGKGIEVIPIPHDVAEDEEVNTLKEVARSFGADVVVIDHHDIDYAYVTSLRREGLFVVSIDDEGKRRFCSDILVNYNIYAPEIQYAVEPHTRLLLGPEYALLREQFEHPPSKNIPREHLLVVMGGGYARGEAVKVLEALLILEPSALQKLKPYVVLGAGYPNPQEVIDKYGSDSITVLYNVESLRELMGKTVFAVSGAGGILYELARMGVPAIVIVLDNNQVLIAEYFQKAGIAQNLGWYEDVTSEMITEGIQIWLRSPEHIETMRKKVEKLTDGFGADRVVNIILSSLANRNVKAGIR